MSAPGARSWIVMIVLVLFAGAVLTVVLPTADERSETTVEIDGDVMYAEAEGVEGDAVFSHELRFSVTDDPAIAQEWLVATLVDSFGIASVSLDTRSLVVEIAYDSAVVSEPVIFDWFLEGGYLVPTRDDATPAEPTEDGDAQIVFVRDDGQRFIPSLILARAGIPLEMVFSAGSGTRTTVAIPDFGISQDIAEGGTVPLPAMEPGTYQIADGAGEQEGILYVE